MVTGTVSLQLTDFCDDLFTKLLFAGRYPASAGTLRKTGGVNPGTGKETCYYSTE
jgi:hypothetical protein